MPRERIIYITGQQPRCRNPLCPRDAKHCGLCSPCYQATLRRIKQGKYTREELEERGKLERSIVDDWLKS